MQDVEEEWRAIPGYDGYEVSNLGRVRSWRSRKEPVYLKPNPTGKQRKYLQVALYAEKRQHMFYVHVLVLTVFIGPKLEGMEACHNNGICTDNRLTNLRWGTNAENVEDRRIHGTVATGERHGFAKLTDTTAALALELLAHGVSHRTIAASLGVEKTAITSINLGKTWRHLPRPAQTKIQKPA